MAMDLTGIKNQNEYYTNHYFCSIFEENAGSTISTWKNDAKESEESTPWAKFRDTAKQYYRIRDRYQHLRNEKQSKPLVQEMATLYLKALGYYPVNSVMAEVSSHITVPVFHEITKKNGAPLLWVVLSVSVERGDDILQGKIFCQSESDEEKDGIALEDINDSVLSKMFFAGEEAPRWIIVIGINQIALIDRNKWNEKRYLQFDLDEIFSRHEETTFQALSVLLHKDSLCPEEGNSILDTLDENSHKHSAGVSDTLKYALRECIELLGNEVVYDMKNRQMIDLDTNPVDASELTIECLRYMYRVLFMLFIEARPELGYAPMKSQVYVQGYSVEGLRDICETVREESEEVSEGYYIDDTISELFRLIYEGYPGDIDEYKTAANMESLHDVFIIEPLKAHIFDPEYTRLITKAKLRNCTMIKIVDLMSISRPNGVRERKGRISYSALGINQMGAVYEALLSYRGFLAEETLFEVKRAQDKFNELDVGYFITENELDNYTEEERVRYEKGEQAGQLRKYEKGTFIYRLAGREREKSASYYTPEVLTKCLVKYALKELLVDKTADEILHLTICEPAMGSAAFLNEAINQLAEAYLNKKQEELEETIPFNKRFEELQRVKMFMADRNVYGVDLNPIAVELAEVSLWLNTIYKGAYVPWFGTQLVCGNSLIGARRQVYSTTKLEKGNWYENEPERVMPGEKRKKPGISRVYHFLMGDQGMANYTDKVIKGLESDNIKMINDWRKKFTEKYEEEDVKTLLRLSDIIDTLWDKTVYLRKSLNKATSDYLCVYGHEEDDTSLHTTIREKDEIYHRMYKSEHMNNAGPYARLKCAMDYWCALWFWPINKADLLPSRQEFLFEMALILEGGISSVAKDMTGQISFVDSAGNIVDDDSGKLTFFTKGSEIAKRFAMQYSDLGEVNLDELRERSERLKIANQIATQQRFQHWELEFADLFAERGGFDLVIGNPPWVKTEWSSEDSAISYNPEIYIKEYTPNKKTMIITKMLENSNFQNVYIAGYMFALGIQNYLSAKQNYSELEKVQNNLFLCFLPLAWNINNDAGISALVHPENPYTEANCAKIREQLYPKLRRHYQFINEKNLFPDVAHTQIFSLNVYSNKITDAFESIANLFEPNTIDDSYDDGIGLVPGIKEIDKFGKMKWSTRGHKDRIINIGSKELKIFADFSGCKNYMHTTLQSIHAKSLVTVFEHFANIEKNLGNYKNEICSTEMWHETNAQSNGTIEERNHFPENAYDFIYSGPHISVANPLFQSTRKNSKGKADYDLINLQFCSENYLQRTKYGMACTFEEFLKRSPDTPWGTKYINEYKLISRKMLNLKQSRTLMSAIVPKGTSHINGIFGIAFRDIRLMSFVAGLFFSIPYDYLIRCIGKTNLYDDNTMKIPVCSNVYENEIVIRVLLLNCLTENYTELWNKCYRDRMNKDLWAKKDDRLCGSIFSKLDSKWKIDFAISNMYQRRELLLEIDVLVAMLLGLSLLELKNIYRIQFPVVWQNENTTWYDKNGNIVYRTDKSLIGMGIDAEKWNTVSNYYEGEKCQWTFEDNNVPGGPIERTIEYVAPFDRCDREKDYDEIWHNFEERFKINK